ncbi:DUF6304 family protein [Streptomyces sp. NPDC059443]|uniref:DUF6304 family protein n=1 Tax=unclassified Streptomyces TaxID=2593676 RepID=UPI003691C8DB
MTAEFTYDSPQEYPAVVHDRWGRFETVLVNDGQHFSLALRGNRFQGPWLDGLEPAEPIPEGHVRPPDLADGGLASCVVEWRMPVEVTGAEAGTVDLGVRLLLGDPKPRGGVDSTGVELALHLPTGTIGTVKAHGWMEDALLDLQGQLAEGVHLQACITCAFSDYSPAGSGLIGTMACFRDSKDAYRAVRTKRDLFEVLPDSSGWVQETFLCDQYERRAPNTGYRG